MVRALWTRSASAGWLLAAATLCCWSSSSYAEHHRQSEAHHAFTILPKDDNSISVSLTNGKAACSFSWSTGVAPVTPSPPTRPRKATVPPGRNAVPFDVRSHFAAWEKGHVCLSKRLEYWDYEVCLDGKIKQFHGTDDVYQLATRGSAVNGTSRLFTGGQPCTSERGAPERRVMVDLVCAATPTPVIVDISEPSVCLYAIRIADESACADPSIPRVEAAAWLGSGGSGSKAGGGASWEAARDGQVHESHEGTEDWVLEIMELDGGLVECRARTTERRLSYGALAVPPSLSFRRLAMLVRTKGGGGPWGAAAAAHANSGSGGGAVSAAALQGMLALPSTALSVARVGSDTVRLDSKFDFPKHVSVLELSWQA